MLQAMIIEYLESKGWYFDWEHVNTHLESVKDSDRARVLREEHAWTMPQWGAYWKEPYDDVRGHKNYGKPRTRRYEGLKDALWSQLMREEDPDQFEVFFT